MCECMNGNADSKQEYCGLKYIAFPHCCLCAINAYRRDGERTMLAGTVGGEVEASAFK